MKPSKFSAMLFCVFIMTFLTSCGGSEENKDADATATDSAPEAAAVPAEINTIITEPQGMMVVRHKVSNFEKWKTTYETYDSMRLANGVHSYVISRSIEDSDMVFVAVKVDDMAKAKAFGKGQDLKKAMQRSGVTGSTSVKFFTMVFQDTAAIDSKIRSATTFKVKDWDHWKKSFDSTRQLSTDNGLVVRAYGYDPDDNHNVVIVSAITDTAKARTYWNSDLLKQRRAASGAIGTPERFVYQIVQRY